MRGLGGGIFGWLAADLDHALLVVCVKPRSGPKPGASGEVRHVRHAGHNSKAHFKIKYHFQKLILSLIHTHTVRQH